MCTAGKPHACVAYRGGLPPSSPEESSDDKDVTVKETSDEDRVPAPVVRFTMEQEQAHFDNAMQVAALVFVFPMLQEEQQYNLQPLKQHRLTEGQITDEHVSEEAVATMVTKKSGYHG